MVRGAALFPRASEKPRTCCNDHDSPTSDFHVTVFRERPWDLSSILELREIRYRSQVALPLEYKGVQIAKGYVIDLLIEDCLVVEIKSVDKLLPIHFAQLMTYMRLLRASSGLLMNFNVDTLPNGIRRVLR